MRKAKQMTAVQRRIDCANAPPSLARLFLLLLLLLPPPLLPVRLLIISASFPSSWFQWTYTERRQSIRPQDRSYCTLMVRTPTMLFVELSSRGRAAWMLSCARLCVGEREKSGEEKKTKKKKTRSYKKSTETERQRERKSDSQRERERRRRYIYIYNPSALLILVRRAQKATRQSCVASPFVCALKRFYSGK